MNQTRIIWLNRKGERVEHTMGFQCSLSYARDWWRRSILECQGALFLSRDEARESKLKLLEIQNPKVEE